MKNPEGVTILLLEDNDVDVEGIQRAFRQYRVANPVVLAQDGVEGLELLRRPPQEGGVPRPCMILLDLEMPRMNGVEFLQEVRADPDLRGLTAFVLTTSSRDQDVTSSYELNVAGYMLKSKVGDDFAGLVDLLSVYWKVVEFPREGHL